MSDQWRLIGKKNKIVPLYCGDMQNLLNFYTTIDKDSCTNLQNWYESLTLPQILTMRPDSDHAIHETPTYKLYFLGI